jgi:Fur family transcriptional regulator, ferric uptake regulator
MIERETQQRRAIREAFTRAGRPLAPHEILAEANPDAPTLGIATVYRNVKSLVDEGWLKTVELPGQPPRYELADIGHHHHFHCTSCGKVFDIEGCVGKLGALVPKGYELDSHDITLYGRCDKCAAR